MPPLALALGISQQGSYRGNYFRFRGGSLGPATTTRMAALRPVSVVHATPFQFALRRMMGQRIFTSC